MATEQATGGTEPDADDVQWADQSAYEEQTAETEDVVLPDGEMKMRVIKENPQRFASMVERYGIADMAQSLDEVPEQADMQQNVEDLDVDELDQVSDALKVVKFYRDVILPNIAKPESVHWAEPEADGFDLSRLTDRDKMFLVAKITGQDPDDLIQSAEDRVQRFQGNR